MGYETEKQEIPEGFTHLGEDLGQKMKTAATPSDKPATYYPELHFEGEHAEHLKDLPDHGTATIHFKKISHSTHHETRHGKEETRHRVGIQIHGIKDSKAGKADKHVSSGGKEVSHMTHPSSSHDDAIDKGLEAAAKEADVAEGEQA